MTGVYVAPLATTQGPPGPQGKPGLQGFAGTINLTNPISLLPLAGAVPQGDSFGVLDPEWIPEVISTVKGLADQALVQFNQNERLIAAGF